MIRLYDTTKKIDTVGKIRLYSEEQRQAFEKIDKYQALIEEAWQAEEVARQAEEGIFRETLKPSSLFGAVGRIGKEVGAYAKAVVTRPGEVAKGVYESAVLKPIEFTQRILQPSVKLKPIEEIIGVPEDEEGKKARDVGDFLGWLAPYSVVAKATGFTLKALTTAPKVVKYIPAVSDFIGFIGTGQILYEKKEGSSRLKQLRNDVIALGIFKGAAKGFRLLRKTTTKAVVKEVDNTITIATSEFKNLLKEAEEKTIRDIQVGKRAVVDLKLRPKEGPPIFDIQKPMASIEKKVAQVNTIVKKEIGLTPKEYLQKEIIGKKPEVKVLPGEIKRPPLAEPIPTPTPKLPSVAPVLPGVAPIPTPTPIKPTLPIKPVGKPSKIARSIEAKAIEKDLTKGFKELAEYTPTTIREQANKMAKLMKDVEQTKRVAMGIEPLPKGLNGATVIATMEKYALKNKDGNLMAELAKSPLVSETSIAGQTLRLTAEREPESAVRKIQAIIKVRKEAVKRKLRWKEPAKIKADIKKSLEREIKKAKPRKYSWVSLIDEIKC